MQKHAARRATEQTSILIRPPDALSPALGETNPNRQNGSHPNLSTEGTLASLPRWLSVEQVRKLQRMRRETVIDAMRSGELPFEKRGRICYIRLSDVVAWEERRLNAKAEPASGIVHADLAHLL